MSAEILEAGFVSRLFDLRGRVAAVVGGGSGLGAAMAVGLAQAGAAVAVVDIAADGAERTRAEIAGSGGEASTVRCDVTDRGAVEAAVAAVLATHGRVDILVNSRRHRLPLPGRGTFRRTASTPCSTSTSRAPT